MNDEQQNLLKKLNRRTRFTQFLAWLALFFTMVGIAAGYKNWLRIHEKAKTNAVDVAEIKSVLPKLAQKERLTALEREINKNYKGNTAELENALLELRKIQSSTQNIAETVYTQVESLTKQQETVTKIQTPAINDWSLGEVHFLLQTGLQLFNLKQDQRGAVNAFKLADALLVERASIELLPLRKQISKDIASIKQYAGINTSDLSQKIDMVLDQLKPVAISTKEVEKAEELISAEEPNRQEAQKNTSLVSRVKTTINNAVVIRKENKTLQAEMDNEEKERLYQLLSLRLETLRLLLLQGDDTNYHQQVKRIMSLIKNYYPIDARGRFLEQLAALDKVNLDPILPDISSSLKLLEELMSNSILEKNKDN